uniref:Negative elongation factor complex member E n=1 Tax=Chelonoidis abingdonii TaxID=106734 RepID=A0A8C0JFB2_CHEAB
KKQQSSTSQASQGGIKRSISDQPVVDTATATEQAKMLVKTGAISAIKAENKNCGFKRSRTLEGKLKDPEKGPAPTFQPFQRSLSADDECQEVPGHLGSLGGEWGLVIRAGVRGDWEPGLLGSLLVSGRGGGAGGSSERLRDPEKEPEDERDPEKEPERGEGLRTFEWDYDRDRSRERSRERDRDRERDTSFRRTAPRGLGIRGTLTQCCVFSRGNRGAGVRAMPLLPQLNGAVVEDVQLKVSIARKQPMLDAGTGKSVWGSLAVKNSAKGSHRDRRSQVVYNEDLF